MTVPPNNSIPALSPESAVAQSRQQHAVIIDVREPHEYQQEHITGAISLPLADLTVERLPAGKAAILYCGAGKRSCASDQHLI